MDPPPTTMGLSLGTLVAGGVGVHSVVHCPLALSASKQLSSLTLRSKRWPCDRRSPMKPKPLELRTPEPSQKFKQ
eukprot:6216961-Amphidinium_carterae.1